MGAMRYQQILLFGLYGSCELK